MKSRFSPSWWSSFLLFSFSIIFPSITVFKKLPPFFLPLYVVVSVALLFVLFRWAVPARKESLSARLCIVFLAALLVALAAAHVYVHPMVDIGGFRLAGITFGATDVDDAIDLALNTLFDGRYPYSERTFLNAPITPMPGALLLALPFHLTGFTALQNVFWFGIFWFLLWTITSDIRTVAILAGITTFFSPNVIYQQIIGTDYLANGIYVLTAMVLLMRTVDKGWLSVVGFSAFAGVTLASRPHWLCLVPILWAYWAYRTTALRTLVMLVSMAGSFALLALPFFLYDPSGFSPLHVIQFVTVGGAFPSAHLLVGLPAVLLATGLAYRFGRGPLLHQVRSAFFVQGFLILAGFGLAWVAEGQPDLMYSHFGTLFISFGVCAFGPALVEESQAEHSHPFLRRDYERSAS